MRQVDTREYLDMVCQALQEGKKMVPVPVAGGSMTPFLHPGDTVFLDLLDSPPKKGDIILFTRPDGRYILHRIVQVRRDGTFILLGDAQTEREVVDGIHRIHARVTCARHKGQLLTKKSLRWWFFATVWMYVVPFRYTIIKIVGFFKRKTR